MAISTNDMKPGVKVLFDGDPYSIIENEYVKPGKGQAFNRLKIRNLKNGRVIEKTMRSAETAEAGSVERLGGLRPDLPQQWIVRIALAHARGVAARHAQRKIS